MSNNYVYRLGSSGNDFNVASLAVCNQFTLPYINCTVCGEQLALTCRWVPSVKVVSKEMLRKPTYDFDEDTPSVSDKEFWLLVKTSLANIDCDGIFPTMFVGSNPIEIPMKGEISEFSVKHIRQAQPVISCSGSDMFTHQMMSALSIDPLAKFGEVTLTNKNNRWKYFVLESPYCYAYDSIEHEAYGISECFGCRSLSFKVRRGSYRQKLYRSDLFSSGPVILQARENNSPLINDAMKQHLVRSNIKRLEFTMVGTWGANTNKQSRVRERAELAQLPVRRI